MPPSEGQEPRALTVAAQAIDGRKCAETARVHPDLRIVYNLAYGVLAGAAGRFSLVGDYTTIIQIMAGLAPIAEVLQRIANPKRMPP
jgi:hypothetical protein